MFAPAGTLLPLKNAIAVFVTTDGLPYQQGCPEKGSH
jgi:hypothetical protein